MRSFLTVILAIAVQLTNVGLASGEAKPCSSPEYPRTHFEYRSADFHGDIIFDLTQCWNKRKDFKAKGTVERTDPTGTEQSKNVVVCSSVGDGRVKGDCYLSVGMAHPRVEWARYKVTVKFPSAGGGKRSVVVFDETCHSVVTQSSCD